MRGGKRKGAGRPKVEGSKVVRVPDGCLAQIETIIELYKSKRDGRETDLTVGKRFFDDIKKKERKLKKRTAYKPSLIDIQKSFDMKPRNDRRALLKKYGSKDAACKWLSNQLES